MASLLAWLRRLFPDAVTMDARERARSVIGALLGIFITGIVSQLALGSGAALPWMVAPMGASALLLFAVPASPLAQPWPVIGGNVLSALVGVTCAQLIDLPLAAACVAVSAAIAIMFALRCLHPPGGAVALAAALGGPAVTKLGYGFALSPVGLNTALLLLTAVAYNNLCGRRYPHLPAQHANKHGTADALPTERTGITPADLDAALRQYNQMLDVSRDDLEEILLRAQMQAYQRRFGEITCGDIMSRDVVKVEFGTSLQQAWRLLDAHDVKALPVVNRFGNVIGIVTRHDFIKHSELGSTDDFAGAFQRFLASTSGPLAEKPEVVGQIMTASVTTATADQPVASLVPLFSDKGFHGLPVVGVNRKLLGIVTQSDLVAALFDSNLEQAVYQARKMA